MNDDLISRAAAFDSVEIFLKQTDAPEVYPGLIPALARVINNVPSAQQVRTQMSSADCISRQDAIEAADRADYTGLAVEDVKKVTDEVVKEIKKLPSAQPEQTACEYCHEDSDGYVRPIEKNSHAWLIRQGRTMKLRVCFKGGYSECDILFCPMCGRRLTDG